MTLEEDTEDEMGVVDESTTEADFETDELEVMDPVAEAARDSVDEVNCSCAVVDRALLEVLEVSVEVSDGAEAVVMLPVGSE